MKPDGMQARYDPATITVFGMTDIHEEDKTMDLSRVPKMDLSRVPNWKIRELNSEDLDGKHAGMLAVFDGNELKAFIDEPSFTAVVRRNLGTRKSETGAKLSFLAEHSAELSGLPSGLDAAVGEYMFKTGSDFTKALKEVTGRNSRMAALWEARP